jgi:hypothetical protein
VGQRWGQGKDPELSFTTEKYRELIITSQLLLGAALYSCHSERRFQVDDFIEKFE